MSKKLLLTLGLCLSMGITPAADPARTPVSRYQIITGQASVGARIGPQVLSEPLIIRLDTHTGDTWILQKLTTPGNESTWVWVPLPVAKPEEIVSK